MIESVLLADVCKDLKSKEIDPVRDWYNTLGLPDQTYVPRVLDVLKRWGCGMYDKEPGRTIENTDLALREANNYYAAFAITPALAQSPTPKGLNFLLITNQRASEKQSFPGKVASLVERFKEFGKVSDADKPGEDYVPYMCGPDDSRVHISLELRTGTKVSIMIQYDIFNEQAWINPDECKSIPLFRIGDSAWDDPSVVKDQRDSR
jgi:hypothetical protein